MFFSLSLSIVFLGLSVDNGDLDGNKLDEAGRKLLNEGNRNPWQKKEPRH